MLNHTKRKRFEEFIKDIEKKCIEAGLKITEMTTLSDNQVIAARARAQERQCKFEGGHRNSWQRRPTAMNGRPGGGGFSCGFNESGRFNRIQILDERCNQFDRRGSTIDTFEDDYCCFTCAAVSFPEPSELTRLQKMRLIQALPGENLCLTQSNIDIISEHLNLNITLFRRRWWRVSWT